MDELHWELNKLFIYALSHPNRIYKHESYCTFGVLGSLERKCIKIFWNSFSSNDYKWYFFFFWRGGGDGNNLIYGWARNKEVQVIIPKKIL